MSEPPTSNNKLVNFVLLLGVMSWAVYIIVPNGGVTALAPVAVGSLAVGTGLAALILSWFRPTFRRGNRRAVLGLVLGVLAVVSWRPIGHQILHLRVRAVCASNLRGIAQALRLYHADEKAYPPDLQLLVQDGMITPQLLECPLAWFRESESQGYFYVVGLSPGVPPDWILAYDSPYNHGDDANVCVLYASGEVKTRSLAEFADEYKLFREKYIETRGEPPTAIGPRWP